jgi:hypothetical protein
MLRTMKNVGSFGLLTVALFSGQALAGFTLVTNADFAIFTKQVPNQVSIDDTFQTDGFHRFAYQGFIRDSSDVPLIQEADFINYRYSFEGTVTAVNGNTAVYIGTYAIVFDLLPWGVPDFDVSVGTFNFEATYVTPQFATIVGNMYQTSGPDETGFFDLTFGTSHPMSYVGTYTESEPGVGGEMEGRIVQSIPGAGVLPVFGAAGLMMSRRRRS